MNRYLQFLSLILLTTFSYVTAAENDCSEYFFVQQGNIPVLLTSPHGAAKSKLLPHLPLRKGFYNGDDVKSFVNRPDMKTDLITHKVNEYLMQKGLKPFVVIAGITRSQIDFNRRPTRAYEHELAIPCYQYYHRSIRSGVDAIREQWGHGFMLDIHGQSRFPDEIIRGTRNKETITGLLQQYGGIDVTEKNNGFYFYLREQGYDVQPQVGKKERYYYGGFTVKTYGSHQADGLDALQVEIGRKFRTNKERRNQVIRDIGRAVEVFYQEYYQ